MSENSASASSSAVNVDELKIFVKRYYLQFVIGIIVVVVAISLIRMKELVTAARSVLGSAVCFRFRHGGNLLVSTRVGCGIVRGLS